MTVTGWDGSVAIRVDHRRGQLPERDSLSWLELNGELAEAVKGVSHASVSLHISSDLSFGQASTPSIGSIIATKPHTKIVVSLSEQEFDRIWALASANQIKSCYFAFSEPYRGSAMVVSFSVSSKLPDEE